ncbi:hypothetical protein [Cytobacillus sp. NCCP-133]|uniref:hypothetical protein n=1 Tax=Cytobacillus sp. NCCP-133 TaxID=766848 RepID=UPI00222E7912|nr:hypothetical protein [Cytobacillus sp. NCCP-133]GLB61113.1 hypothetical protein NCCP133_32430 [Cytobacillus sp. NCCP-133]
MVKYVKRRVRIEQFGKAKGKSIADFRPKLDEKSPKTHDHIAMELDVEHFVIDFTEVFLSQEDGLQ